MEWTEETIARLKSLWAEGHSTAEIGRRMGVSKNAVVGKAHRLNLPARPSPIRRPTGDGVAKVASPRRVTGSTLPPLPASEAALSTASAPVAAAPVQAPPRPAPAPMRPAAPAPAAVAPHVSLPPISAPEPVRAPALRPVTTSRASSRFSTCCWPIGEPGKPSFRFCDADAMGGKPYCSEHAALAYVKIRDRREEAA